MNDAEERMNEHLENFNRKKQARVDDNAEQLALADKLLRKVMEPSADSPSLSQVIAMAQVIATNDANENLWLMVGVLEGIESKP